MGTDDNLRKKHVIHVVCRVRFLGSSMIRCPITVNDKLEWPAVSFDSSRSNHSTGSRVFVSKKIEIWIPGMLKELNF